MANQPRFPGLNPDNTFEAPAVHAKINQKVADDITAGNTPVSAALDAASVQATTRTMHTFRPEDYGAVGDGITDDTAAMQAAIDAARDAGGGQLYLRFGAVYVITAVSVQAGLTVEGNLARFLRPANTPNWTRMVSTTGRAYSGDTDSLRPIAIRNLVLDGNLANQGPYKNWEQEQSSLVFFNGNPTKKGREWVVLDNITTVGSVSDGVHIVSNVRADIGTLTAVDCFRGGLTLTGGNSATTLQRYHGSGAICGAHIDMEIDSHGYGDPVNGDSKSFRHDFTVEGQAVIRYDGAPIGDVMPAQIESRDGAEVVINNPFFHTGLYLAFGTVRGRGSVTFRGGIIDTFAKEPGMASIDPQKNHLINPESVTFEGTTLRANNVLDTVTTFDLFEMYWNLNGTGTGTSRLTFNNCDFKVGKTVAGNVVRGIRLAADPTATDNWITINGGSVSSGYTTFYSQVLGGKLRIGGGFRFGAMTGMSVSQSSTNSYLLEIGDIVVEPTCTVYLNLQNTNANCVVTHKSTVVPEARNQITQSFGSAAPATFRGSRVILMDAPPTPATDGLTGDIAQMQEPEPEQPFQWVCTGASYTGSAVWEPITTVSGPAASGPTIIDLGDGLSQIGV